MASVQTSSSHVPAPSLLPNDAAIKQRQRATWASGDFSVVASRIVYQAEQLCETADLQAGWRVLDVATGSGNAALAAARRGCEVVGSDFVPALLERGRLRAQVEHLSVDFIEGDAEHLPFPDASFDAVISIYGVMFASNHQQAAAEIARVCRPGGRIALRSAQVTILFSLVAASTHCRTVASLTSNSLFFNALEDLTSTRFFLKSSYRS